jgi:hypothetical protein
VSLADVLGSRRVYRAALAVLVEDREAREGQSAADEWQARMARELGG